MTSISKFIRGGTSVNPIENRMTFARVTIFTVSPADSRATFYQALVLVSGVAAEPEIGQNITLLDDGLPENPTARLTVAVSDDGRVVGCLVSTLGPDNTHAWYGSLAVDQDYRGHGLANQLVQQSVADRARVDGCGLAAFAYVRIRQQLNYASFRAFHPYGFVACKLVHKHRDALGVRARHWDEAVARLLLISKAAVPMPDAAFNTLGQEAAS